MNVIISRTVILFVLWQMTDFTERLENLQHPLGHTGCG